MSTLTALIFSFRTGDDKPNDKQGDKDDSDNKNPANKLQEQMEEFQTSLDLLKTQHANEITSYKSETASKLAQLSKEHAEEIVSLESDVDTRLDERTKCHADEISTLKASFETEIAKLESDLTQTYQQNIDQLKMAHQEKIEDVRAEHQKEKRILSDLAGEEIELLRAAHAQELEIVKELLSQQKRTDEQQQLQPEQKALTESKSESGTVFNTDFQDWCFFFFFKILKKIKINIFKKNNFF